MKTRRQFIKASAGAVVPLAFPTITQAKSPNGKLQHACIGADGQGWSDLTNIASHKQVEIVALCDVDTARMAKAVEKFPNARRYQDWRSLLASEGDLLDSVNVSVPDHMHAEITLGALEWGKHVYCEKPLTHDVGEARDVRLAAEKAGVATQMGNQIQSAIEYRMAVQMLRDGVIGKIHEVHAWSNATFPLRGRPAGSDPIPETLDWDRWLGVAPVRPYKKDVYHAFNWRGWQDFGGGPIGDFGCHIMDTPFKALELTAPTSILAKKVPKEWAENEAWNRELWPDWEIIEYVFPGTKFTSGNSINVTWYDGGKQPPRELFGFDDDNRKIPSGGSLLIGEGGKFLVPHVAGPQLVPYKLNKGIKRPDVKGFSHYHAFVDACLGKGTTGSNFNFAGPLTEATLLGTIANRFPGTKLDWDAANLRFKNSEAATALVRPPRRQGW